MINKLIPLIILLLCLAACTPAPQPAEPTAMPTETAAPPTEPTPTTLPAEAPSVAESQPVHSQLYIPGVDVEYVVQCFSEVCLDAEYTISGDASLLQKWADPILYTINGDPTEKDLAVLAEFTAWLNTIDGFPGMVEVDSPGIANLRFHFCSRSEMLDLMGKNYKGLDGAMTFWYSNDEIYDAIICVRTDLDQYVRNSVILEEIYNALGPAQDTDLRKDSIIYSGYSEPQSLTEIDELILKLLYHPDMQCGMEADACEAVIRQLYD